MTPKVVGKGSWEECNFRKILFLTSAAGATWRRCADITYIYAVTATVSV